MSADKGKLTLVHSVSQRQNCEYTLGLENRLRDYQFELKRVHEENTKLKKLYETKLAEEKKNSGFIQLYDSGINFMCELILKSPGAAILYLTIAQWMESHCGALPADRESLAHTTKVSIDSIDRYIKILENEKALMRLPYTGRTNAYALNPEYVWKSYNTNKKYSAFTRKTLENMSGYIVKRMMVLFKVFKNKKEDKNVKAARPPALPRGAQPPLDSPALAAGQGAERPSTAFPPLT